MNVKDLILLMAEYCVFFEDGTTINFKGTAFMLWTGLREFLAVAYPEWKKIDFYVKELCSTGTIHRCKEREEKPDYSALPTGV